MSKSEIVIPPMTVQEPVPFFSRSRLRCYHDLMLNKTVHKIRRVSFFPRFRTGVQISTFTVKNENPLCQSLEFRTWQTINHASIDQELYKYLFLLKHTRIRLPVRRGLLGSQCLLCQQESQVITATGAHSLLNFPMETNKLEFYLMFRLP